MIKQPALILGLLLLVLASCKQNQKCGGKGDWTSFSGGDTAYNFEISATILGQDQLIKPANISGKHFCLEDKAPKFYPTTSGYHEEPCFQLSPYQVYTDEVLYPRAEPYYEILDPNKFFDYYKSVPVELNKFLVIKIADYNKLMMDSEGLNGPGSIIKRPESPDNIWSTSYQALHNYNGSEDATVLSLRGLLHSLLLFDNDAYIYLYLPLNVGLKTLQYDGVLTKKAGYKTEINNLGNPSYRLTPKIQKTLSLSSFRSLDSCEGYSRAIFSVEITPELLRPVLARYQRMVQEYLNNLKKQGISPLPFPDPYAQP